MKKAPAWVKALMLMCFLAGADASGAAGFPEKPIKVVTTFTPGFGPRRLHQALASEMSKAAGVPVVVENRPGGRIPALRRN